MQNLFENQYQLQESIGRGSYAEVWRARERNGNRQLRAVKKLQLDPLCQQLGEVQQLRQLRGDHIIEFYGYIRENNELSIIMHYCQANLRQRLQEVGKLQPLEVINLITQVTSAMLVLQKSFVMHLDLKPENILIQSKNANDYYKICDFGCSQIYKRVSRAENPNMKLHSSVKINDFIFGTPSYIAPEIQLGHQKIGTNSCDVWSLGIVVYQSIYKTHPFERDEFGRVKTEQFKNFADGKKEIQFPATDPAYPIDLLKQMLMPRANLRIKWIKIKQSLIRNYGKSEENFINIEKIYRHTIKLSVIFANVIQDIKNIIEKHQNNCSESAKLVRLRRSLINFGFEQLGRIRNILSYKLQQKLNTSNLASIQFMKQWFLEEKKDMRIQKCTDNIKELQENVKSDVAEIDKVSGLINSQIRGSQQVQNLLTFIKEALKINTLLCRDELRQIFTETSAKYGLTK